MEIDGIKIRFESQLGAFIEQRTFMDDVLLAEVQYRAMKASSVENPILVVALDDSYYKLDYDPKTLFKDILNKTNITLIIHSNNTIQDLGDIIGSLKNKPTLKSYYSNNDYSNNDYSNNDYSNNSYSNNDYSNNSYLNNYSGGYSGGYNWINASLNNRKKQPEPVLQESESQEPLLWESAFQEVKSDIQRYRDDDGKLHKDDGPAIIQYKDGEIVNEEWWHHGKLHRQNNPARIQYHKGDVILQMWYQHNLLHREKGPADITLSNGKVTTEKWYQNSKLHRLDGPAIKCADGYTRWYINGENVPPIA